MATSPIPLAKPTVHRMFLHQGKYGIVYNNFPKTSLSVHNTSVRKKQELCKTLRTLTPLEKLQSASERLQKSGRQGVPRFFHIQENPTIQWLNSRGLKQSVPSSFEAASLWISEATCRHSPAHGSCPSFPPRAPSGTSRAWQGLLPPSQGPESVTSTSPFSKDSGIISGVLSGTASDIQGCQEAPVKGFLALLLCLSRLPLRWGFFFFLRGGSC